MNIEDRLRDALAQRAGSVEVSPGALFEIQRRLARTGRRPVLRRLPEVRLRPALVLAAAACAAVAAVVSVSLSSTAPDPTGEIAADAADATGTDTVTPLSPSTPTTAAPQAPPETGPTAETGPPPDGMTDVAEPEADAGEIATVAPPAPPPADPPRADPLPPPPTPAAAEIGDDTKSVIDAGQPETEPPETPPCPVEPIGGNGDEDDEDVGGPAVGVTVYFACGESDAVPRYRPAAVNDLATALGVLLSGPNEADTAAGFRGLPGDSGRTATSTPEERWVTIDLPTNLAEAFSTAAGGITADQFLAQLNATVFEFPEFIAAEYRLNGDCAGFGDLLGRPCEIHTRDGGSHTSELTAHSIGAVESIVRAEPRDGAAALGFLADGARLTDRRAGGDAWAEVITTGGVQGWVSTEMLVAQPLVLDSTSTGTMANLARRLTTSGQGIDPSSFLPGGLVLRWGAGPSDIMLVPTAGAGVGRSWWDQPLDIPSPRDGSATSSPADLLLIDGSSDSAVVRVNAPGPLGEPHPDFSSLAYVSVYQTAVSGSSLPPDMGSVPDPPTTTTTEAVTTSDGDDLPPPLPGLIEEEDTTPAEPEPAPPPEPLRAQVSVIFDFLSPGGPRIAAVEAIWIEP